MSFQQMPGFPQTTSGGQADMHTPVSTFSQQHPLAAIGRSQSASHIKPTTSSIQSVLSQAPTISQQLQGQQSFSASPQSSFHTQASFDVVSDSHKTEMTAARLCRIGQGLVQEIVAKAADVFGILKTTQLPNHLAANVTPFQERKKPVQDNMKMIVTFFKQLRQTYTALSEESEKLNTLPPEMLIPIEGECDDQTLEKSESYHQVAAEHSALSEQLRVKNQHLKEIIDQMRNLLWELNSMIAIKNTRP